MKRSTLMLGLALIVAASAAAVSLGLFDAGGRDARTAAAAGGDGANGASSQGEPAPMQALLATPQARDYRQRQQFQQQARSFFREAAALGPAEREQRAQALGARIDHYEQANELSAGETLLLRVGLIQATEPDPARQQAQVRELAQRYRAQAAQREQAWADQQSRDPKFQAYKQRESAVVAEVMALASIPGGLSRDAYLRQRLQAERERIYR
jgi:hypothetical protein